MKKCLCLTKLLLFVNLLQLILGVEQCLSKLFNKKNVGISLIERHNQSFSEISAHLFARNIQVPVIYLIYCLFYTHMMSDEEVQNTPPISSLRTGQTAPDRPFSGTQLRQSCSATELGMLSGRWFSI